MDSRLYDLAAHCYKVAQDPIRFTVATAYGSAMAVRGKQATVPCSQTMQEYFRVTPPLRFALFCSILILRRGKHRDLAHDSQALLSACIHRLPRLIRVWQPPQVQGEAAWGWTYLFTTCSPVKRHLCFCSTVLPCCRVAACYFWAHSRGAASATTPAALQEDWEGNSRLGLCSTPFMCLEMLRVVCRLGMSCLQLLGRPTLAPPQ